MKANKCVFYITQTNSGKIIILFKDQEFYRARNREPFAAVEECYAFLSSWSNAVINVDPKLQNKIKRR